MSTGLLALLDDVVALAKVAAASIDDAAAQAGKAASKAAGVVIDDTAVTPRYVVGFAADRELPIIGKITLGSLRNKLLFLLPAALALSFFAPWLITPLLMAGGVYLCFEGFEKIAEIVHGGHEAEDGAEEARLTPAQFESAKVRSAVSTDFILSAEIMAITLANVADAPFLTKVIVLAVVGIGVTLGVYGVVALIVKADDVGVALARERRPVSRLFGRDDPEPSALDRALGGPLRWLGRALVQVMPRLLALLSAVGTAAMLWVGGGILLHGAEGYGFATVPHAIHQAGLSAGAAVPVAAGAVSWLSEALLAALAGLLVGGVAALLVSAVGRPVLRLFRRRGS